MSQSITSESHNVETTSESDLLGFYCPTCHFNFDGETEFKLHYHSDIHHYNMKRKLVGLKPATEAQFQRQLQKVQIDKEKADKKNQSYYCEVLNQKFSNYTTFAARINTKKYQKALEDFKNKSMSVDANKDMEEDKPEQVNMGDGFKKKTQTATTLDSTSICLFSNCMYESFEKNLKEMQRKYGFFIWDEKNCVKKEQLIKYLAKLIQKDYKCIYCQQRFKSADSCQKHIIAKQHALMNSDQFDQYERFYDFREENRRIAKEMQERFKNTKADNAFVYTIKNKPEKDQSAVEDNEDDWEDEDDSKELEGRN